MIRRAIHPIALSLAMLPLAASPGRANSITTYGVIITTLGNDLQVQNVDKSEADAATSGNAAFTTVGGSPVAESGVVITPNGSGGMTVLPLGGSNAVSPVSATGSPPASTAGEGGGAGGGGGAVSTPVTGGSGGAVTVTQQVPVPSTVNMSSGSTTTIQVTDTQSVPVPAPPSVTAASPPPTAKTPEPASISLLAVAACGGIGMIRRRRS
jgi:hypothetical protein